MLKSFIDMTTWAQDYLIETRVAMASLWHQKATPVVHDVIAYVDMHRMEVSLAVFLTAFVFLAGILAFNLLKMRKALQFEKDMRSLDVANGEFWHRMWDKSRESNWNKHCEINGLQRTLAQRDEEIESKDDMIATFRDDVSDLHVIFSKQEDVIEELRDLNAEKNETIESLEEQLEDANSEVKKWFLKHDSAEHEIVDLKETIESLRADASHWCGEFRSVEAANDDLLKKVHNLEQVVLRAA